MLRKGRDDDCHTLMQWIGQELGYRVEPISKETERDKLQREYIAAVQTLGKISTRMERVI